MRAVISLSPAWVLWGRKLLEVRAAHIAIAILMPVIERNELLEVKTGGIGATMLVLVVGSHLLLEIKAQGIGTAKSGFTEGSESQEKQEESD